MRTELEYINGKLASHWVDLEITDKHMTEMNKQMGRNHLNDRTQSSCVDFAAKRLRRVFNNGDWSQGGRFYRGWWQNIPKEYRRHITIDGKATVEIDYSGMHPALMYAEARAELGDRNAYDVGEPTVSRSLVKRAFNMLVNAPKRPRRPPEYNEQECGLSWQELLDAVIARHRPIAKFLGTSYGLHLQNKDAQIANRIMLAFLRMQYVCLPVHDSFIVHHDLKDDLASIMSAEFCKVAGLKEGTEVKFDVTTAISIYRPTGTPVLDTIGVLLNPASEYAGYDARALNWWTSRI